MAGELLADGDPIRHVCSLPPVPSLTRHYPRSSEDPTLVERRIFLVNAVAQCASCGRLCVSREDTGEWSSGIVWKRLRWWHRRARRKLCEEAA